MHGTEGEVYANPQRCPQINLIDAAGTRVLHERADESVQEKVALPESKDPEITARWIERCVSGSEPVPQSLKIQLACCRLPPVRRLRSLMAGAGCRTLVNGQKPVRWLGRANKGI